MIETKIPSTNDKYARFTEGLALRREGEEFIYFIEPGVREITYQCVNCKHKIINICQMTELSLLGVPKDELDKIDDQICPKCKSDVFYDSDEVKETIKIISRKSKPESMKDEKRRIEMSKSAKEDRIREDIISNLLAYLKKHEKFSELTDTKELLKTLTLDELVSFNHNTDKMMEFLNRMTVREISKRIHNG